MVSSMRVVVMVQVWFLDSCKVTGVRVKLVQKIALRCEGFVNVLLSDRNVGRSSSVWGSWDWPHHAAMLVWQWWRWVLPGAADVGGNSSNLLCPLAAQGPPCDVIPTCSAGPAALRRFPFNSNPIQNKSPARRTLYLVVLVMQSFEATCWLPKTKHKTILEQFFQH